MKKHLCFHGIGACTEEREPGESRYWVAEDLFLRVLDGVAGREDVELSFDDGNASDVEIALPALSDRGLDATFFVLAGRLYDPSSLAASDLRELRDAGMRVGSHGWQHVPWRGLTVAGEERELVDARTALEEVTGSPVTTAALPLGRYDRGLLRSLKAAGYTTVYSSDRYPSRGASWLQARYSVMADSTLESVMDIIEERPGRREARNVVASVVKRLR